MFLRRELRCLESDGATALRIGTQLEYHDEEIDSFNGFRFVVPGAFYGRNDNDGDGVEDYLGTYAQDYRDDRNPGLSVTCYSPASKRYIALMRTDLPRLDPTLTARQVGLRHFVHDTDIGSLGFAPSSRRIGDVALRMDYPFCERVSYCLNVDGSGWSAYLRMRRGDVRVCAYAIGFGTADTLTEASWSVTKAQMDRLLADNSDLPFSLEASQEERLRLIAASYREFPEKVGQPAGYFMHFSPRRRLDGPNILEYGFSGAQTLNAYIMLRSAKERGNPEWRRQALNVLQFFVDHCIAPSGLPNGIYDIDREAFIYWWTGILYPFQYARTRRELEEYVGWQVVSSLSQIADALRGTEGNYCRTMVEAMHYLLLAYIEESEAGHDHPEWLAAVRHFCDALIGLQNADGSWNRAYSMEGEPFTQPPEWFGRTPLERGSGSLFPCEVLVNLYRLTKDARYLDSALKAADFIRNTYVPQIQYVGGLNDTTHIKSVKIDSVGVMFAMRSLWMCYDATGEERYLIASRDAARALASWIYLWDVPFAPETLLGENGFRTTGWAVCDVIPAGSYVDDELPEFIPDMLQIALATRDRHLLKLCKAVTYGMQHGLSMPGHMYGYAMPGVQCEGYLTGLWLSDMQDCAFSGAVAKMKGSDNDTCNGLTNAQALYNLYEIRRQFGALDFDRILNQLQ